MNAVMLSIRPQWCELIANGKKTIEVRKTHPKLETPFKCYIYCTQGEEKWLVGIIGKHPSEKLNGKVIGEFVCDRIERMRYPDDGLVDVVDARMACLTAKEIIAYSNGSPLYAWHISALQIYDKPKELSEYYKDCGENPECEGCECRYVESNESVGFYEECCSKLEGYKPLTRPPQSWGYVEELT